MIYYNIIYFDITHYDNNQAAHTGNYGSDTGVDAPNDLRYGKLTLYTHYMDTD